MERAVKGIWIPIEIWEDEELSITEKAIFAEIDSLDGEDHCFATNEYIANFCKCSERTVSSAITKLINRGFISVVSFDGRTRVLKSNVKTVFVNENNAYELNTNLCCIENISKQERKKLQTDGTVYNIYNNNIIHENINDKIKENIPSPLHQNDVDLMFAKFWKAYPKKVNKAYARKCFAKAIKKVSLDTLLSAIENQKQSVNWMKSNGQFIPDASTWLNNERWDDEVEIQKQEKRIYVPDEPPYDSALWLSRKINQQHPDIEIVPEETLQKWAAVFDKIEHEDKRNSDDTLHLMRFIFKSDFWKDKISNPWDLRKNYVKLRMQAEKEGWF